MRIIWIAAFFCALKAFESGGLQLIRSVFESGVSQVRDRKAWQELANSLLTFEESLRAGIAIDEARWRGLLAHQNGNTVEFRIALVRILLMLRERGARVLPTLHRARGLALFHAEELARSQARTAQPQLQACLAFLCVPGFAFVLRTVLPESPSGFWTWLAGIALFALWSGIGALWVQSLARNAQWGGLLSSQRSWIHAAPLGGEVFLASLQSGSPPDLAWVEMVGAIREHAPDLSRALPLGLWNEHSETANSPLSPYLAQRIVAWGRSVHQAVHISLLEGKPCRERVEHLMSVLRGETLAAVQHSVEILPTRALVPLFICTAPALVGTLIWTFTQALPGVGFE